MSDRTINYTAESRRPSQAWLACGIIACCVAVVAIAAPLRSIAEVASFPPGTSMRPMSAVGMLFLAGAAGLFIALPLSLCCLIGGRRRRAGLVLGLVSFLLGIVAVFGDGYLFNCIVASRGYVMEP